MSTRSSLVSSSPSFAPSQPALTTGVHAPEGLGGHESGVDRRRRRPSPQFEKVGAVAGRYLKYVALFVGAGLISGSVVHFPLAPLRYTVIGVVGAVLFAAASVLAERSERGSGGLVRVAISALALALGIGMISGSIQHFQDIPDRAATLIPLGVVLSLTAFVVRNAIRVRTDQLVASFVAVTVFAAILFVGLHQLAGTVDVAAGDHHGAATSEPVTTPSAKDDGAHTGDAKQNTPSEPATAAPSGGGTTAATHADDGHGHR